MHLDTDDFKFIVKHTNLFAIDIIIKYKEKILVARRNNPPARNYYFVPGGRVFKDEPIKAALKRILLSEIGFSKTEVDFKLVGIFDHIYPDNVFAEMEFGTHYIVTAVLIDLTDTFTPTLDDQHEKFEWLSIKEIPSRNDVHTFVKNYFVLQPENCFIQNLIPC